LETGAERGRWSEIKIRNVRREVHHPAMAGKGRADDSLLKRVCVVTHLLRSQWKTGRQGAEAEDVLGVSQLSLFEVGCIRSSPRSFVTKRNIRHRHWAEEEFFCRPSDAFVSVCVLKREKWQRGRRRIRWASQCFAMGTSSCAARRRKG
jgi:hypothetical protein